LLFHARRGEKIWIVFSDDMRVRKNTLRAVNVRFDRIIRLNRALNEAEPFSKKWLSHFFEL
jgi:hypothetical protein